MSIPKTAIKSTGAPAPPPFLSQAIQMGDFLFCSGQVGCRPDTGVLVEGSIQNRTVRSIALAIYLHEIILLTYYLEYLASNSVQLTISPRGSWDELG